MEKEEELELPDGQLTLDKFVVGEQGIVISVLGEGKIRHRLFDMGVTPGATILLRKKAPLGDPIEVNLRGYELSLRKSEAKNVILKMTVTREMLAQEEQTATEPETATKAEESKEAK